jgi:purine-nucleoside phosphorylase
MLPGKPPPVARTLVRWQTQGNGEKAAMTPHIEAKQGDYAEAILLPGDPLRAKWIAETFLHDPRLVNRVRNCLGYTGTYKGKPVSVQATGMGQPSLGIYVHELITLYGAKTLLRVGTCGGLSPKVKLRDIVIAQTASTDSAMNRDVFGMYNYAPTADFALLRSAVEHAESRKLAWHVGGIVSSDVFYHPDGIKVYDVLAAHGVLGVEMETAALYTLAARHGVRAVAICAVSDSLVTGDHLGPDDRQSSLKEMADLALTVATGA